MPLGAPLLASWRGVYQHGLSWPQNSSEAARGCLLYAFRAVVIARHEKQGCFGGFEPETWCMQAIAQAPGLWREAPNLDLRTLNPKPSTNALSFFRVLFFPLLPLTVP